MTNKKFKLAAMSLALTACVAASPLAANAETGTEATSSTPAVETPAPTAEPSAENAPATNETKQESTNESKQESTDESKKESTNESKQESTDESKKESTDESKKESTDDAKQESTGESKQNPADETKPEVAVENKALAEAPAAKAPVLMTAALAPAPAAPATPMEEDTVATITGQDGTTTQYKSFDEAVSKANNGDTIKVVKDTETAGMNIDKKLTIQGVTKTTTKPKDDGTVEETTVKPKLTFKKDGIALWGTDLTFKDMQVEMKGVGSTPYAAEWNWMTISASKNATLTLDNTDMTMDGTGTADNTHAIYFGSNNKLNVQNGSNLTIQNYKQDALEWDGGDGGYNCNITGGSTFTSDNNRSGFTGTFYVTVDDSDVKVINSTGSGSNGSYFTIKNESDVLFDNNSYWGISAWRIDMSDDSTLTATNNGYSGVWTRVLNVDKTCTLDVESNGKKATSNTTNPGIFFQGNGKFKSVIEEGADVTIKNNAGSGIYTKQTVCDLTIGSATITNNGSGSVNEKGIGAENGGGIYNIGTLKLGKDVTITGNTAKNGGGVYTKGKDGKVTINSSTITENKATGNGGGICAEDNSTVTVVGGEISSNEAAGTNRTTSGGGGIFANKGSTVKLNDTTVSENKVTGDYGSGGGVRVDGGKLTVDNAKILDNATNNNGGGISVKDSELSVTDSQITGNNAWNKVTVGERIFVNGNGGGIEIIGSDSDTKEYTITNTQITQNTTGLRGGGIYAEKASLTITKSTLDGNKALDTVGPQASSEGGGLSVRGGTNITLDSTTVTNNSAKDGGGIWVRSDVDTSVSIKNGTTINNNQSIYGGGGVMIRQELGKKIDVTIEDAKIETNAAENGGGIYLLNQVDLKLKNITVSGNTAKNVGGGIFGQDGTKLHADNLTVSNNTAASGGGVYLWNTGNSIILAELLNSFIDHNTVSGSGGGIFAYNGVQINANNTSISNNKSKSGGAIWMNASDAELTGNTITHNTATGNGGGIYGEQRSTIGLRTGALYNNHAGTAGDDMYLNNTTLILRPVGDDWILDDCGHPIDGWYLDGKDARWDADSQKKFVTNLDALLEGTDYMIEKGEDGCYIITIGSNALALKAAHNAPSEPKPDPDGPDTPNPNPNPKPEPKPGPDTSITPEDPQLPPVQDARADTPDSPVLPSSPANPAVQDAHALPQTGTSLFAALAMALSGFALTIAGAWASLLGKNSRH